MQEDAPPAKPQENRQMIRTIRNKMRKNRGFTLVELMIVVAIVGILAALAIYGVSKYMKSSKTTEARNSLGQVSKDAAAAFSREKMGDGLLAAKATAEVANTLCNAAANKVPAAEADIRGKKYQSSSVDGQDWQIGDQTTGWKCLRFTMDAPQYFQYAYIAPSASTGVDDEQFTAQARGDLDADGTLSTFSMNGRIQGRTVTLSPNIGETEPEE
jgi:type IV pilus assembly protein PilA